MTDVEVEFEIPGLPGQAIDVSAIEERLAALWRTPSAVGLPTDQGVPTRTSVLNLVMFASSAYALDEVERAIGALAIHHPSRAIVFAVDSALPGFDTSLDAQVSAHCHVEQEEQVVTCYDKVLIPTPRDALDYLPSLIAPLVLPDLPTFLWWPGTPPLGDRRFDRVLRQVDRLIVDSLEYSRAAANLARTALLCRRIGGDCSISDLSWARLKHWCVMTAQFFDMPDFLWALGNIGRVVVDYGRPRSAPDNPVLGLLYIGWLASRLGWQLAKSERLEDGAWAFTVGPPGDRDLRIELRSVPVARRLRGQLMAVRLHANDGQRTAEFEVFRCDDPDVVRARANMTGALCFEHALHAPPMPTESLLIDALRTRQHDIVYEVALEEARHYAEALRPRGMI